MTIAGATKPASITTCTGKPPPLPPTTPRRSRTTTSAPQKTPTRPGTYRHTLTPSVSPLRLGTSWQDRLKQQCLDRVRGARVERQNRNRTTNRGPSSSDPLDDDDDEDSETENGPTGSSPDKDAWLQKIVRSEWAQLQRDLQAQWEAEKRSGTLVDAHTMDPEFLAELETELRAEARFQSDLDHDEGEEAAAAAYQASVEQLEQGDVDSAVAHLYRPTETALTPGNTPCPQCRCDQGLQIISPAACRCTQCGLAVPATVFDRLNVVALHHAHSGCPRSTPALTYHPSAGYLALCDACDCYEVVA
ncbi:hypothetical protein IWQ60_007151 [Tieghemiomyces parasiticus]|uniref:RPA-interacting protein C-terminal domain-containing protein n=1 Tax=Tieghemiomyces parasiticus TaxID=78921 RepID=A0A9W8A067_9FUNG|nr:hypothetical protein IWQ60_007151 [Tieghemiomyces parasiticus]